MINIEIITSFIIKENQAIRLRKHLLAPNKVPYIGYCAVSYTHLDVYKRQSIFSLRVSLNRPSPKTIGLENSTIKGCMQIIF